MAQSLIEQLQRGAMVGTAPIGDLLRQAKLAAAKLKVSDFAAWVDAEMNGYWGHPKVPDYRLVPGELKFFNPTRGWCPIYGKEIENLKKGISQPIGELQALIMSMQGPDFLTVSIAESIAEKLRTEIGFGCEIKMHVSSAAISGIIEAVRNNVLEWTLKLETAGITGEGFMFTPEETRAAQNIGSTHIYYGAIASVTHGVSSIGAVSQTNSSASPQDIAEAIERLLKALPPKEATLPGVSAATAELAASEIELRSNRISIGRITKAFNVLYKAEDIALRVPEVVMRLHDLGQMLGLV